MTKQENKTGQSKLTRKDLLIAALRGDEKWVLEHESEVYQSEGVNWASNLDMLKDNDEGCK
jgi:hypothetical protein